MAQNNGEFSAEFGGNFTLEKLYLRTEDEILRFKNLGDSLHDFIVDGGELSAEIEEIKLRLRGCGGIVGALRGGRH